MNHDLQADTAVRERRSWKALARSRAARVAALPLMLAGTLTAVVGTASPASAAPCTQPIVSAVACENTQTGSPASDWDVGAGDVSIQGYATSMSVNVGQTVSFKIKTTSTNYHVDIVRLGYYNGAGARKVASNIAPSVSLPQTQPTCLTDASTGLVDCGNWAVSASWAVPSTAVSGVYLAHLVRDDTSSVGSVIPFVVRNDASTSAILMQTDDSTWQAYNTYGGQSLYSCTTLCPPGNPHGYQGAFKVSYNRPFNQGTDDLGRSWLFYAELNMIRFLERNGYDVSYTSQIDVETRPALLKNHSVFTSTGHDEYWSATQRANVEAARDAGVNLAFFTGNEVFWKTRYEPSIDGTNTATRTLVTYKETHFDNRVDPLGPSVWTGTWADPRWSPPADGGKPQNALTGQYFVVNSGTSAIQVPFAYKNLRIWRGISSITGLTSGQTKTLGSQTLGYEWDADVDNGFRPAGLFDMSSTTVSVPEGFLDYGTTVGPMSVTHNLVMYKAASGALVFGAGTVQWSFGLDSYGGRTVDAAMQQATVNLFADMNAQPQTLQSGLVAATKTTDTTAPTATISTPAAGSTLSDGAVTTISGTASDSGGQVAGVEVSTDNGTTWHPATGTTSWTYSWITHANSPATIKVRAVDDSGNLQGTPTARSVNVNCPCSLWGANVTPKTIDGGDTHATEVGTKFTTDTFGQITGVRFYKASGNTGTHVGNLWASDGSLLARVNFSGESASGWQQANFTTPVAVSPGQTYVISYFAPNGHYSEDTQYFYNNPAPPLPTGNGIVDSPPLHAVRETTTTDNGVFSYGATTQFPTTGGSGDNYWVDPVFATAGPPNAVTSVTASAGYASATLTWNPAGTGGPPTSYTVTPYIGTTAQTPTVFNTTPLPTTATITGLTNGTTYTFTVTAANPAGTAAASPASNAITPSATASTVGNGTFESGLGSWTRAGNPLPSTSTTQAHGGTTSALLGTVQPANAPAGDSTLTQTVTVPTGTSTLSFWYWPATADTPCSGTCPWDYQEVDIRSTGGAVLASIFKKSVNTQAWTNQTFDMTPYAGQSVVLRFNVHQDGSTNPIDDTWMYIDDVSLTASAPPTAPGAPTGVTATAGQASATVSWTAPASNGGSPITGYTITPFIGTTAQTATTITGNPPATTATISSLSPGTAYTFKVAAVNAIGTGTQSGASNSVTPTALTQPGVPTGVTAVAGNASATVSWTAPSNGGSTITSYTITPYKVAETAIAQTPITITGNPPSPSTTITGLTNGTNYNFTVYASNAVGTGNPSTASNLVTPAAPAQVPGAPTNVVATGGDGSATVSWTAPSNGGSTITSYTVTPFIGTTAQVATTITGNPAGTSTTVTGLANGTTYTFQVAATNATGTGAQSAASNAVTPAGPPSTPTAPLASAGNGSATLTWSAPANGGSTITSYTVTPFIGASAQTATTITGAPPATSTTINGLANGTTYTFTVSATNAAGTSGPSPASNAVTPTAPATCPCTILGNATPANLDSGDVNSVELGTKFTADINGQVTGVRFYKSSANTGTHTGHLWTDTGTLLASVTFSGESATGWQTATFPTPVNVTAGATYVISYLAPTGHYSYNSAAFASTGIDAPPLHALANSISPNGVFTYSSSPAFPSSSFNATNYWVDVVFSSTTATVPAAPTGVTATAGNASATVSWTAPANGGSAITGYTITPFIGTTAQTATTITGNPPATTATITGLTNGTAYTFKVAATNAVGTGTPSAASNSVTPFTATAPAAPTGVTATAGNASATVTWTAPSNGGSAITSYTITPFIGTTAQTATTITGNPPVTTATITGLTNGTAYTFKVAATNAVGTGTPSAASNSVTPSASVPGAPTGVTATAGNGQATVSWTAPSNGGSVITSYTITPFIGSTAQAATTITGNPPVTTATVTGLTNGTAYTFKVAATNAVGTGTPSSSSNAVTPTAPGACPCNLFGTTTPANLDSGDTNAVELGLKFTADVSGQVTGVRFYKSTNNTGTHTGHLWNSAGTLLATVNFSGETASGWQTATFPSPVSITAGTTYVISYFTRVGRYSFTSNYFASSGADAAPLHAPANTTTPNGVFVYTNSGAFPNSSFNATNYWVDPVFSPFTVPGTPTGVTAVAGNTSATVSWTAPANGGTGITGYTITPYIGGVAQSPTTIAGNPPSPSTTITGLTNGTAYTFRVAATNAVGTGSQSADSNSVTPTQTTTVPGAPSGVTATAGNASATVSWTAPANGGSPITGYTITPYIGAAAQTSTTITGNPPATSTVVTGLTNGTAYTFKVAATNAIGTGNQSTSSNSVTPFVPPNCPCTMFGAATPANVDSGDTNAVELGMAFTADLNGTVSGVRFYKSTANTGTHVGHLWDSTGTLLATVTFTNETASGWQQASFTTPVAITAGTTYVISYYAPNGHYSYTGAQFATPFDNAPLHAPADSTTPNGVFAYGNGTVFPASSFNATNYWVDVVYSAGA